jgi:DNA-3-methyladenine glycosylase II
MSVPTPRGFDIAAAARALRRADPELARWMRRIGPIAPDPRWQQPFDLVDALARAILYQQLSGKAAATIVGRVEVACASRTLTAKALGRVDDLSLRGCGVSQNKLLALRDLCAHAAERRLPSTRALDGLDDATIIESLVAVRGIGRWTVEMLLIFRLGRPDVFPLDDLGIRKGVQRLRGMQGMPPPKHAASLAEPWAPWRSLASLYLWRIADAP